MSVKISELASIYSKDVSHWHDEFDAVKNSDLLQKQMMLRMNTKRILQSLWIMSTSPSVVGKAIRGAARSLSGEKSLLRAVELSVTYKCNAKCMQCSCRKAFDPKKEISMKMTKEMWFDVIDQAASLGAFQFVINGGEPMLEEQTVYELTKYITDKYDGYVHLCSNGLLLDETKIQKLRSAGLNSLEMGFDSAYEDIHDGNRAPGGYRKILENIQSAKRNGLMVILNTILTNDKVKSDDIVHTIMVAKAMGCFLQITPCCLTGALRNRLDMMLTEETKLYFHWLLSKSIYCRSDLYSSLTRIKCPAAREKIAVQPYGDVVSCPLIQITYGNVRDASLKDIQQEMMKNPYYHKKEALGCLPAMSEDFIMDYLYDGEGSGKGGKSA